MAPDSRYRCVALRFGCARMQALLCALLAFRLLPRVFDSRRKQLRAQVAPLLGVSAEPWLPARITYDTRRSRLYGLIECIPRSRRYRVTPRSIRVALCYQHTYARVLRATLAAVFDGDPPQKHVPAPAVENIDRETDRLWESHELAA